MGYVTGQYSRRRVMAAEALSVGNLVMISGWDATTSLYKVSKADADAAGLKCAQYIVLDGALAADEIGFVYGEGTLTGQDTSGASNVGDPVYLSDTAGGWTLTAPSTGGDSIQELGVVSAISSTAGTIEFYPEFSKIVTVEGGATGPTGDTGDTGPTGDTGD